MTKPIYATQAADRKEDSAQLQDFFFSFLNSGIFFYLYTPHRQRIERKTELSCRTFLNAASALLLLRLPAQVLEKKKKKK
jgi:hypothetical protein